MSVLIKGMEMPKSCYFCEMYEADMYWCIAAKRDIDSFGDYDNRSAFCPLIPVPPHGRLIEEDDAFEAAWKIMRGLGYSRDVHPRLYQTVREAFATAPTIIPANEEGE